MATFPLPGWTGTIAPHGSDNGSPVMGGSDLMVSSSGTQPVVAIVGGQVDFVSTQATAPTSGGNAVEIRGTDGLEYYYAHFAAPLALRYGDVVSEGQLLGYAGNTGNASGGSPHLHIGIGNSISTGTGPLGGVGQGFSSPMYQSVTNAVDFLKSLFMTSSNSTPASGVIPSTGPLTADQIYRIAVTQGFTPGDQAITATALSLAENQGRDPTVVGPVNTNGTKDAGLWQVNSIWWQQFGGLLALLDPITNGRAAFQIFKQQGFNAWTTFRDGTYLKYWAEATAAASRNPDVKPGDFIPGPGSVSDPPSTGNANPCQDITIHIGPWNALIPDYGCLLNQALQNTLKDLLTGIQTTIQDEVNKAKVAWGNWQTAHMANYAFVGLGLMLIMVGFMSAFTQTPTLSTMAWSKV